MRYLHTVVTIKCNRSNQGNTENSAVLTGLDRVEVRTKIIEESYASDARWVARGGD